MKMWALFAVSGLAMTVPPAAAVAADREAASGAIMATVERLQPGEYLWLPEVAPEGPVLVMISLATQRAVVYRNGVPIGVSTISSGKDGHETPTGIFTILQRKVDHKSNLYDDAPMPYMQRLTWDGIALHAGTLPGYPASHGCIRLPLEFAKQLYGVTKLGLTVVVTDEPSLPRVAPTPDILASDEGGLRKASAGDTVWEPEVSPSGPVSIIVSAADRRVIVLRNGKEIGSAPVEIRAAIRGTSAYSLQQNGAAEARWLRLALPGAPAAAEGERLRGKIVVDDAFKQAVLSVVRPGTTVVVTADSLHRGSGIELELAEPHS